MIKESWFYLCVFLGLVCCLPACWPTKKQSGLLVVNVLSADLYDDCHIDGSMNVPFQDLDAFIETLDEQAHVVFYCSNYMCSSSGYAAKKLQEKGFKHVWAYEGGMAEWYQSGLPVKGPCRQAYLNKCIEAIAHDETYPVITTAELAKKMRIAD